MDRRQLDIPDIRPDGLQMTEWRGMQRWVWRAERIAWFAFLGCVVLAALGLTGAGGPLSRRSLDLATGSADLPAITRSSDADSLSVRFEAAPGVNERTIFLSRAFVEAVELSDIQPTPRSAEATPEGWIWTFAAPQGGRVNFVMRPQSPRVVTYRIGLDEGPARPATMLILP